MCYACCLSGAHNLSVGQDGANRPERVHPVLCCFIFIFVFFDVDGSATRAVQPVELGAVYQRW